MLYISLKFLRPKQYSPADQRDLALLAYLYGGLTRPVGKLVDLWQAVPFTVSWSSVGESALVELRTPEL